MPPQAKSRSREWFVPDLVQASDVERPFLNPEGPGQLGLILPNLLDESLRVLPPDEHVDRLAERTPVAQTLIAYRVDDQRSAP